MDEMKKEKNDYFQKITRLNVKLYFFKNKANQKCIILIKMWIQCKIKSNFL